MSDEKPDRSGADIWVYCQVSFALTTENRVTLFLVVTWKRDHYITRSKPYSTSAIRWLDSSRLGPTHGTQPHTLTHIPKPHSLKLPLPNRIAGPKSFFFKIFEREVHDVRHQICYKPVSNPASPGRVGSRQGVALSLNKFFLRDHGGS